MSKAKTELMREMLRKYVDEADEDELAVMLFAVMLFMGCGKKAKPPRIS